MELNEKAKTFLTVTDCHHGCREDTKSSLPDGGNKHPLQNCLLEGDEKTYVHYPVHRVVVRQSADVVQRNYSNVARLFEKSLPSLLELHDRNRGLHNKK